MPSPHVCVGMCDTERLKRSTASKSKRRFEDQLLALQDEDNLKIDDGFLRLLIFKDAEYNGDKYCLAAAGFKAAPTLW
jgi:hypothetical protein